MNRMDLVDRYIDRRVEFVEQDTKMTGVVCQIEADKDTSSIREVQLRIKLHEDPRKIGFRYRRPQDVSLVYSAVTANNGDGKLAAYQPALF